MSAQHAPRAQHTPPLWRRFISLPHTRLGWWAIGLASPALVLMAFTNVLALLGTDNPQLSILGVSVGVSGSWVEGVGVLVPLVLMTWSFSALFGGIVGFIAVARDRSLLLWVAQVPGLLIFSFFVWAAISILGGESRGEADVRVTFPIAVLLWAIANLAHMWSTRNSGES